MSAFFTIIAFCIVSETYEPILLRWKAERLRHETKDWALHSKSEENPLNLDTILNKYLMKPLHMIVKEPIVRTSSTRIKLNRPLTNTARNLDVLHVSRLWHSLPDLRSLPHKFSGRPKMDLNTRLTTLPCDLHRCRLSLPHDRHILENLVRSPTPRVRKTEPRRQTAANDRGLHNPPNRSFLVRMVFAPFDPLECPSDQWHVHRSWHHLDFHVGRCLHGRRLHAQRQQRHSHQHIPPLCGGSRFPPLRHIHV